LLKRKAKHEDQWCKNRRRKRCKKKKLKLERKLKESKKAKE